MRFTLGMLGPINVSDFREHLSTWRDEWPKGLGGSPVNLLCRELLRRDQRVVVFTLDPSVKDEVVLEGKNVRLCIGPFRPRRARDFFREERRYLARALRREEPTILHAQWTYEYALAAQASGLPHIITAHDAPLSILRHNFIPYRIARTAMAYRVVARANRIISVSPYVARHLRRFMLYRGTSRTIPNGMPPQLFQMSGKRNTRGDSITYATVLNGWGELKNGRAAIRAFASVRESRRADRLMMFGAGHGSTEPAALWAREHNLHAGIVFVGAVGHDELLRRLAEEVDVLVHPSLEEAQPMALIEAMALEIPVIGGRKSGGVPWTLDEGRAGVLVDVASPDAIARAMHELAQDASARDRWGRLGKAHALKHFHIGAVADAYLAAYRELLERT